LLKRALLLGLSLTCGCFGGQYNSSSSNPASSTALKESVTWKDTTHHYDSAVLTRGTPRSQVLEAFGAPNEEYQQNGTLEDVFAFYADGTKFVNPTLRPRNVALSVVTLGGAAAARAARRVYVERQLTRYYVYYDQQQKVAYVAKKAPAAEGAVAPSQSPGQNAPQSAAPRN
jgi:hypothetical protein